MKTIKLTESQFHFILESNDSEAFNGGDLKEFPGSEVCTTNNIEKDNGEKENGKPVTTDDIQDKLAIQNYWANGHNGARVFP